MIAGPRLAKVVHLIGSCFENHCKEASNTDCRVAITRLCAGGFVCREHR